MYIKDTRIKSSSKFFLEETTSPKIATDYYIAYSLCFLRIEIPSYLLTPDLQTLPLNANHDRNHGPVHAA